MNGRSTETVVHRVTHRGVEIVFNSVKDKWFYTLHGRDRSAKTLGNAMAEINKPAPEGKVFERVECLVNCPSWRDNDRDTFEKVMVTSIAEDKYSNDVWTVTVKGKDRSKRRADSCYLITPINLKLMQQIKDLSNNIVKLGKMKNKLYDQLESLRIPKND